MSREMVPLTGNHSHLSAANSHAHEGPHIILPQHAAYTDTTLMDDGNTNSFNMYENSPKVA
jgi:hypothetical protein